jgi:type IV pilus assembly protein PilV
MKRNGFSLIEVLISFVLATCLLLGTAGLAVHSLVVKKRAEDNLKMVELASSKLEYFKTLPFESKELEGGFRSERITEKNSQEIFEREWKIEDRKDRLKRIEIEVFPENNPQKRVRVALLISRELGF